MKAVRVLIAGRVQGVWFRASTQKKAVELGVDGFVRNLRDGRVEGFFQGEDDAVDALVQWCHEGPVHARVDGVDVSDTEIADCSGFVVAATHGSTS